ncbi:hypothetical protein LCGC14_2296900, partial [marine sediment metagenome]
DYGKSDVSDVSIQNKIIADLISAEKKIHEGK